MAPTTIAGALTLQNAEALAGMALCQIRAPRHPRLLRRLHLQRGHEDRRPAFGTPEYAKATQAGAQLARRYRVPFRASSTNASNAVDAQAAYESEMSLWASVMAHTNLVNHAAGWLEGGLTASYEKLVIDAEMCQLLAEYLEPVVVDDDTLAIDAIAEVQPGGHFFGAAHTLARYQDVFYTPIVSDWRNFETWQDTGALSAARRANAIWKQLLAEYEPPPIDPGIDEALREYVAKRKRAIEAGEVALEAVAERRQGCPYLPRDLTMSVKLGRRAIPERTQARRRQPSGSSATGCSSKPSSSRHAPAPHGATCPSRGKGSSIR